MVSLNLNHLREYSLKGPCYFERVEREEASGGAKSDKTEESVDMKIID